MLIGLISVERPTSAMAVASRRPSGRSSCRTSASNAQRVASVISASGWKLRLAMMPNGRNRYSVAAISELRSEPNRRASKNSGIAPKTQAVEAIARGMATSSRPTTR